MLDLTTLLPALETLTRRKPEVVSPTTVRAHLTPYRFVEITNEPDGWTSVWAVGTMLVAGRKITTAVLTSHVHDAAKIASAVRGAGARLSEVMGSGTATPKLGDGVFSDDTNSTRDYSGNLIPGRVLLYTAPTIDQNMAVERCVTFMMRNSIELVKKDADKAPAKSTKSAKSKAA